MFENLRTEALLIWENIRVNPIVNPLVLLARRGADSPMNQWLNEHPVVAGLLFMAIGAVLAGSGLWELKRGVAHDKYGNAMTGGTASFVSMVRIVGGIGAFIFGLYKLATGI